METPTPLECRVQLLEDIEAVRLLMARYHELCDGWGEDGTHRDPQAIAQLFTDDGVWDETVLQPPPRGHAEIAALATELQSIPWIVHFILNPVVRIDKDTAEGEFKAILRLKFDPSGPLIWAMGMYQIVANRTPDGWRFRSMSWEPFLGDVYDPSRHARHG